LRANVPCRGQNSEIAADASSAVAAIVRSVTVIPQANSLTIEVALSTPYVPEGVRLTTPHRLVFDFPGYKLQGENRRVPVNKGPVQQLRLSLFQVQPPVTRLVIDSKDPLNFEVRPAAGKVVIEIDFPNAPSSRSSTHPSMPAEKPMSSGVQNHSLREIPVPVAGSRPSAYSLQARARALKLEDLQSLEERAQAGDPEAETTLALAYHDAGDPKAQFRLGKLLAGNSQSPDDRVSAYKWLLLAQSSIKESSTVLGELRKSMSEQEVAKAEHVVDNWQDGACREPAIKSTETVIRAIRVLSTIFRHLSPPLKTVG